MLTDIDKALVERLRADWPEIIVEKHWMMDSDAIEEQRKEAADRIEAQAAEIERLRSMVLEGAAKNAAEIVRLELEIDRLREAGTKLAGYAGHDDNCEIMLKGVWGDKTPCDCGYEDAWKALRDALGETK